MFFFERVKTGEPGEVRRSKCGEGRRETNRVWSWEETWSDLCSPKVCLLNKRGEGMAGLSEEDELEFAFNTVIYRIMTFCLQQNAYNIQ